MTIQSLERVMWRLTRNKPADYKPTNDELERAIMYECGTHRQTYYANRRALIKLGWIRTHNSKRIRVTGRHLTSQ